MNIKSLYTAEQIQEAVQKVAQQIENCFGSKDPVVALCLLNGAIWYAADLLPACLPILSCKPYASPAMRAKIAPVSSSGIMRSPTVPENRCL